MEKPKSRPKSSSVRSRNCTIATPMPMSEKRVKKEVKTVTIARMPNSSGVTRRARMAVMMSWAAMLVYFEPSCTTAARLMLIELPLRRPVSRSSPRFLSLSSLMTSLCPPHVHKEWEGPHPAGPESLAA